MPVNANVTIPELPEAGTLADDDILIVQDSSGSVTSKVTLGALKSYLDIPEAEESIAPVFTSPPAWVGGDTAQVGVEMTITPGVVTGTPTPTVVRTLVRDGVDAGAVAGLVYTPVEADEGLPLELREDATNALGTASSTSAPTENVLASVASLAGPAIYVIAGQSNAGGQTDTLDTEPSGLPLADVRYWAVDALTSTTLPSAPVDLDVEPYTPTVTPIGCELQLGVDLNAAGRNVAIAKYSAGSTGIFNHWQPWQGADPADLDGMMSDAIASARAFIDALIAEDGTREPYIAGVIWNQWETDAEGVANFVYSVNYQGAQEAVIDRFRAEFHPDLPVYVTAVSPDYAGGNHATNVANCLANKAAAVANRTGTTLISTTSIPLKGDGVHYTVDGQQTLGGRIATQILSESEPSYSGSDVLRVDLYTSRATANAAGGTVLQGPCDELWAIENAVGAHFVPADTWTPATTGADTKAQLWIPADITMGTPGNAAQITNAAIDDALLSGHWHIPLVFGFDDSNAATVTVLDMSTNNVLRFLSNGRAQLRANSSSALSGGLSFDIGDTCVMEVDFTSTTDNFKVYVNDVLVVTLSQANNWSAATQDLQVGHASWTTASQWLGTIGRPVLGAYTP